MSQITWRRIPRFPQYEVSNVGEVRRCQDSLYRYTNGNILSIRLNQKGYPIVRIWVNNKMLQLLIHQAVAESFHGPRPEKLVTNHIDGNKLNNTPENLVYVTNRENIAHATALGLKRSKIPEDVAASIKSLASRGISTNQIAVDLSIGTSTVNRVLHRVVNDAPVKVKPKGTLYIPTVAIEYHKWKPAVGFEGVYEISNFGALRRCDEVSRFYSKNRIMRCYYSPAGYLRATLCKNGRPFYHSIHSMVAAAFIGPCPKGMQIDHKDGDKQNNAPENLEYVSCKTNLHRHIADNIRTTGRAKRRSKLTTSDVAEIRRLSVLGFGRAELGRRYDIPASHVSNIVLGKKWKESYV